MLVFSLPSERASERVQVWRRLQKFGSLPFRNAGYLLPNTEENRERLMWVAEIVRTSNGEASVMEVASVDDVSENGVRELFRQARDADYLALGEELKKIGPAEGTTAQVSRLRRRFDEIAAIDFFDAKQRGVLQAELDQMTAERTPQNPAKPLTKEAFQNKLWVTRPRPGIDRVSSAWLICRFIDANARFVFAEKGEAQPGAIPFDMYEPGGFGHEGDRCTFETLCRSFELADKKVLLIAQSIHDADLEDHKFGREEGQVIQRILQGWTRQDLDDQELLRRGMELVEGLYLSIEV